MAALDQLKQTYFNECSELLEQIEAGLTEIREGHSTDDTINAVFRGVHSVKGGAGMFGFDALVEFAHVFETALDAMRRGSLGAEPDVIDVLLVASDLLTDLVQISRSGEAVPSGFFADCRTALERLVEDDKAGESVTVEESSTAPAEFEGIDFTPVRAEVFDASDGVDQIRSYMITFRPKPEMLKKANEPLYIVRELRKLGELDLIAETDALPTLAELDCEHPYIGWTGTLRTTAGPAQVEEAFEFVIGDCELEIREPLLTDAAPTTESGAAPQSAIEHTIAAAAAPSPKPPPQKSAPSTPSNETAEAASVPRVPTTKPAVTTTRIELERIDRVVNMVGELVISQAMLRQIVQDLPEAISGRLSQILEEVVHHTRELKDSVMSMRAQPVGSVFQRMPRLVRDLSTRTGKKIRLEMSGETTEVDRSIIERLGDPLTHIIRNAVDHGIESPAERLAVGKSDEGTIRLAAEHRGGRIVIEISDDGAGINSDRVLKKAKEKGLVSPDATLSEDEMNNLVFLPGFSTAETVSDISGRGVGMDVVRRNIQEIGGRITLKSVRSQGMTIQLALPLTLAVMDGMVIKVGQDTYVMPLSAIIECLRPARSDINNLIGTSGMLQLRGDLVPLVHLGDLLEIDSTGGESAESVVIITDAGEGSRFGLIVDELCGHQQVVIKSIEESYGSVPGIAAATILGDGRVAFILDIEKLWDLGTSPSLAATRSVKRSLPAIGVPN
jgi:two-component system, chemotaxis family, sensor kinase CheA